MHWRSSDPRASEVIGLYCNLPRYPVHCSSGDTVDKGWSGVLSSWDVSSEAAWLYGYGADKAEHDRESVRLL